MKKITINELVNKMATKVDLECKADNFQDFLKFLEDICPLFNLSMDSVDELVYYTKEWNVTDNHLTIDAKTYLAIKDDMKSRFDVDMDEFEYYTDDDFDVNPEDVEGKMYVNAGELSYAGVYKILQFFQQACQKYGGTIQFKEGLIDEGSFGEHNLSWAIDANGIYSEDSFYKIKDCDNDEQLFCSLYWLCENFRGETFEDFGKLGVSIYYEEN